MKLSLYAWETKDLPTLQALSRAEVSKVLLKDASHFRWGKVDKAKLVVPDDTIEMTYTAINTWLLLLADVGLESVSMYYKCSIIDNGLYKTLEELDGTASRLLEDKWDPEVACPRLYRGLRGLGWPRIREIYESIWGFSPDEQHDRDVITGIMLLLIRFLLRYSPDDVVDTSSIEKFLEVNSKCKDYQTRAMAGKLTAESYSAYEEFHEHKVITSWMRNVLEGILVHYSPVTAADIAAKDTHVLPKGSVQNVCKCLFCKELAYQQIFHHIFPRVGTSDGSEYSVRLTLVNKNWKRKRIIAPEDMYHAILEAENEREIDRSIQQSVYSRCMPLHDQSVNRTLARLGSVQGEYDTHDLSSASDSISRLLAYQVFPRRMHHLFDEFAYKVTYKNGQKEESRTLYTFATSGNGCTFILEMLLFFALARVAAYLSGYSLEQVCEGGPEGLPLIVVYGDDIICHKSISKVLIQLLKALGFTRNSKKSFDTTTFLYRESCGGEYLHGIDVSPFYWPRNYTQPDTNLPDEYTDGGRTASLISLINRLTFEETWALGGNSAHQFLLATLKKLYPKLSLGGSVLGDPLVSKCLVRDKVEWFDPTTDELQDTDFISYKFRVEVSADDQNYSQYTMSVFANTEDRIANRDLYDKHKHMRKRWVQTVSVGLGRREKAAVETWQLCSGKLSADRYTAYQDAIKFVRKMLNVGDIKVTESKDIYLPTKIEQQVSGHCGGLKHAHATSVFIVRALTAENPIPDKELAILTAGLDAVEKPLYGITRSGWSVRFYEAGYRKHSKVDNMFSLRYEVSVIEVARTGHDEIGKTTCLCQMLSPKLREDVWNSIVYDQYLQYGPEYNEDIILSNGIPLYETLGVSKRRKSFAQAYSGTRTTLVQRYQ
jgi:hypothetical protein